MSFQQTGQSGSQPVASTQLQQQYVWDIDAGQSLDTGPFLMRGASKVKILCRQTSGAFGAQVQAQVSAGDTVTPVAAQRPSWEPLDMGAVCPLGVAVPLDYVVPGKFLRVRATAPAGNAVTIVITSLCSQ